MTDTRLDWTPVVRSLVHHLLEHDIIPAAIYDGAITTRFNDSDPDLADLVAEAACAVDESSLRCTWHDRGKDLRCSLLLVLGNEPDELVADYSYEANNAALEMQIATALEEFESTWAGKSCPRAQAAA